MTDSGIESIASAAAGIETGVPGVTMSTPTDSLERRPDFVITDEQPAPADSILDQIKAARVEIEENLHLDLDVRLWHERGVPLVVRFKPVKAEYITVARKRVEKYKDPARDWEADAEVVNRCAIGIGYRGDDGEVLPFTPDGELAHFDKALCDLLEWQWTGRVVDVVRYIYQTDSIIGTTLKRIVDWSAGQADADDEAFAEK